MVGGGRGRGGGTVAKVRRGSIGRSKVNCLGGEGEQESKTRLKESSFSLPNERSSTKKIRRGKWRSDLNRRNQVDSASRGQDRPGTGRGRTRGGESACEEFDKTNESGNKNNLVKKKKGEGERGERETKQGLIMN